jgi:predicted kinase
MASRSSDIDRMADERGGGSRPQGSGGELLIVTGSSHTGKSTLIRGLLARATRPAAQVSIDDVIERLDFDSEDRWEHGLHLAYDQAASTTARLLAEEMLVLFESTFTYIPPDGRPGQFHLHELERLLAVASDVGAGRVVVRLVASTKDVAARRDTSGRLSEDIVLKTWQQHEKQALAGIRTITIDTSEVSSGEAIDRLCREIPGTLGLL